MDELITKHLSHLSRSPHDAAVKYFLQTGKVNGSFRESLLHLMQEVKVQALKNPIPIDCPEGYGTGRNCPIRNGEGNKCHQCLHNG